MKQPSDPACNDERWRWPLDALALLAIAIAAGSLFVTTPTNGDFWWLDSSRHAMNGVFLHDLVADGGFLHPLEYASNYYQRYPAINIGFYPPLFYITSAPVLALFGVSHATSQLVVILYAFGCGALVYRIARVRMDRTAATATALCAMLLPGMALWSRQVQIDVPAIAWLLAFAYFLDLHLRRKSVKVLLIATACLGCAILTRAQAVLAIPSFLGVLFLVRYEGRPGIGVRIRAVALLGLMAAPSVISVAYFSRVNSSQVGATPGMPALLSVDNWTWYAAQLPEQMGRPAVLLAILALAWLPFALKRRHISATALIMGALALSSLLLFSLVSNKEPRFNLPCVPFLLVFSALALYPRAPRSIGALLVALAGLLAWQALLVDRVPIVTGMREAARMAVDAAPKDTNILISAHRDGNFIFNLRADAGRPDVGSRRGDKLFVQMSIHRAFGIKDLGFDEAAILEILRKERISVVVEQLDYLGDQPSMQHFARVLRSPRYFREIGRITMSGKMTRGEGELIVYAKN